MATIASQVWNGSYGEVWIDGQWISNVNQVEAVVNLNKTEVPLVGSIWTQHKLTSINGTGSMSGFHVTTDFIEKISAPVNNGREYKTTIAIKVADPDALNGQTYRVELHDVTFDSIPLGNFTAGELVTFELPFTFSKFTIKEKITG